MERRWERGLGAALHVLLGCALLGVVVIALVAPRESNTSFSTWRVLVLMLVIAAGTVLAGRRRSGGQDRARQPWWTGRAAAAAVAVGGATVATALAWLLRYDVGWDARVVAGMAARLADGQSLTTYQAGYLSRYPNNLPLLVVDRWCEEAGRWVGLAPGTIFVLVNGVGLAATLLALGWLVRMLRGPVAALTAQGAVLLLVGLSPWMAVPYTDMLAMPLVVGATAALVAAGRTPRPRRVVGLTVAAAALLVLAYVVKTTPVVSLAAVALGLVLAGLGRRRHPAGRRAVLVALASGVAVVLLGVTASQVALPVVAGVPATSIDRTRTPATIWWVYMAAEQHPVDGRMRYGGYDPAIVRATNRMTGAEAGAWALPRWKHRLGALGPVGYARFLVDKAAWNWGDGLFWAWGEGNDPEEARLVRGPAADAVASWNRPDGSWWVWRAAAAQALWLSLLLVAAVRLLRSRWRPGTGLLVLSVLGIAAFTLVLQGRSRYLLVYVPLVVALVMSLPPPAWPRRGRTTRRRGRDVPATAGRSG